MNASGMLFEPRGTTVSKRTDCEYRAAYPESSGVVGHEQRAGNVISGDAGDTDRRAT
jgi:hypothetical protein